MNVPLPSDMQYEEIDRQCSMLVQKVMSGGCKDMREYGFATGQWVALRAQQAFISELIRRMTNDEEE